MDSPDVGSVVVLSSRQEVRLHNLLGVIGRDLPQTGVRLVATLGQLEMKVSTTAVHLQHLDGVWVRVMDLNHGVVAGVERQLDAHQRFNPAWVWCSRALDVVAEAASAGVDIESVLHQAGLPTKKHHVECCVSTRRNHLRDSGEMRLRGELLLSSPYLQKMNSENEWCSLILTTFECCYGC